MIIGIGTDIVEITRIQESLEKSLALAKRILTDFEFKEFDKLGVDENTSHVLDTPPPKTLKQARYLAKKFASKEATVKAIGKGIGHGFSWQDIEIGHDDFGKPILLAHGAFEHWCEVNHVSSLHISIADEQAYATATVVIES
ncbi:holo-ACP synthase [Ningiella sp. W23]|uniref:holo-ACP synthase n=1 Tax=Ningiella sp. W23 TaxID=3023715 RepID=UPI00375764D8